MSWVSLYLLFSMIYNTLFNVIFLEQQLLVKVMFTLHSTGNDDPHLWNKYIYINYVLYFIHHHTQHPGTCYSSLGSQWTGHPPPHLRNPGTPSMHPAHSPTTTWSSHYVVCRGEPVDHRHERGLWGQSTRCAGSRSPAPPAACWDRCRMPNWRVPLECCYWVIHLEIVNNVHTQVNNLHGKEWGGR